MWYEWFAEAFLPKSAIAIPSPGMSSNGGASFNGLMSPIPMSAIPAPSPLLDAPAFGLWSVANADRSATATPRLAVELSTSLEGGEGDGRIKIGQTTLHNPSGRSSWIGL